MGEDNKTYENERVTRFTVAMTPKEKELTGKMANVLQKRGYINNSTMSECVRYCIHAVSQLLMREIERERFGGKK